MDSEGFPRLCVKVQAECAAFRELILRAYPGVTREVSVTFNSIHTSTGVKPDLHNVLLSTISP